MHYRSTSFLLVLASAVSLPAMATDPQWTGSGELGFSTASGNTKSQNINAQLKAGLDDGRWHHAANALWMRNRGQVLLDANGDGVAEQTMEDTANRFGLGFSSAYDLTARSYLIGTLRYDHDDFASYLWRGTAAVSYGCAGNYDRAVEFAELMLAEPGALSARGRGELTKIIAQYAPSREAAPAAPDEV